MVATILDAYTDEPSGLGVPPYLGTYPRYLAGALLEKNERVFYLTIDDLRFLKYPLIKKSNTTNKAIYNLTRSKEETNQILKKSDLLVVNAGVQTPGKYLTAVPGTVNEIIRLLHDVKCKKILTGPAVYGTQLYGGKRAEKFESKFFDEINFNFLGINEYDKISKYAISGAEIVKQIPYEIVAEIETGKGCSRKIGCSFCLEPIKNKLEYRKREDIVAEIKALYDCRVRYFRLGKQTSFYDYQKGDVDEIENLFKEIWNNCPEIKVLHIDNVDPIHVLRKGGEEITKLIVKYCTSGNVAAIGIESFDANVFKENNLNCPPEIAFKAIELINKYGSFRGSNGMPQFLPGINLIYGLKGETENTHKENMKWLQKILDSNLMLRRINIRQVTIFPGTKMAEIGNKVLKKNRKYYYKWRREIREKIDYEMLKRVVPAGAILKDVRMESYEGNVTYGRQFGAYPLIVGVKKRLELNKFYDIKIISHMLRSVVGEVLKE